MVIYTDGACAGNPGPGGWAALLRYGTRERELSGFERETTNQRMELRAVVEALKALKRPCVVHVYSDSAYLVNAFRLGWLDRWRTNGWRNSRKEAVDNQDLWRELDALTRRHRVFFHKVKGHADDEMNNRVDELARKALEQGMGKGG